MIKINAESDVPIYSQLAEQIRDDIRSRNLPTGTLLPPDRVYCEKLNISHMTVKKAIDLPLRIFSTKPCTLIFSPNALRTS